MRWWVLARAAATSLGLVGSAADSLVARARRPATGRDRLAAPARGQEAAGPRELVIRWWRKRECVDVSENSLVLYKPAPSTTTGRGD
jgi:hypothetical protein